jgi:hypothetical protein
MPENQLTVCPFLGTSGERTVARTDPDKSHRCYAQTPPGQPDPMHQAAYCLSINHGNCPIYRRAAETAQPGGPGDYEGAGYDGAPEEAEAQPVPWGRLALIAAPLLLLLVVAGLYLRDTFRAPAPAQAPAATATGSAAIAATATPSPIAEGPQPVSVAAPNAGQFDPPTPQPGGQVVISQPIPSQVGWWTGGEVEGDHVSDSYLYAGYYDSNAFISAVRFDLKDAPRGAPITEASLRLTGLLAERFDPAQGGTWTVQLIPGSALPSFQRLDFQTLLNTPAAVTLFPTLYPADLAMGQTNVLKLDQSALGWLQERITQGEFEVIARIVGPSGGGNTLFAWDSGHGPATAGAAPQFVLSVGAPPPTPPPLPTGVFVVATLTPTPANILTAAANALAATETAAASALTPQIPVVTPTPAPENLATVQAARFLAGLPPFVIYTPTPANEATATANAVQATAVAVTTGTFTPSPLNAVTPVIVLPTPIPENAATAAAQKIAATQQAAEVGTTTPLPPNAIIATRTPTPFVIVNTATPENVQTAQARAVMATAIAVTTGTFTPTPADAVTATPTLGPAAPPILVYLDQLTPTPLPPGQNVLPAVLRGKVLFTSQRDGGVELLALDPANGRVGLVTQDWPHRLAARNDLTSPDRRSTLVVNQDGQGVRQIFIRSNTGEMQQLTSLGGGAFEPAWSPAGDRIAFTSRDPGNEEIYVVGVDGANLTRLTDNGANDQHPSFSPDGSQIVFWSNRDTGRRQLWVMNADGGNPRPLLNSPYNDYDPIWGK